MLLTKLLRGAALGALILTLTLAEAPAQPPQPPVPGSGQPPINPEGIEVLARGPVHEAYAATAEQPVPTEIAPKAPPEPIEELPPNEKPEGDNVQWIPGYWQWDGEREDFIWVSGFWRVPPPGRVWVPGTWQEVPGGFQWVPGLWQMVQTEQPVQPEVVYLPRPPRTIEVGPTIPPPNATSIYVPGCWIWRERFLWRPGFWIPYQPGWVWIPAHYQWTPVGYVFIDGYWDYPLDSRGLLFSPVYASPQVLGRPGFAFTPRYVVSPALLLASLFLRQGYGNYYFGDYYGQQYLRSGFYPWNTPLLRNQVNLGLGQRWFYDPMWNYYSMAQQNNPGWARTMSDLYVGRYRGNLPRPPHTLAQQNQVLQKLANVPNVANITNNLTVADGSLRVGNRDVSPLVMVAPLQVAPQLQPEARIRPITQQVQQQNAKLARQFRQTAVERRKAEAAILRERPAAKGPPGQQPRPQSAVTHPTRVRVDVPKSAIDSARLQPTHKAPPPPVQPEVELKGKGQGPVPKFEPKQPIPQPKGKGQEPKGKGQEPKGKGQEPKGKGQMPFPRGGLGIPIPQPRQPIPEPRGKGQQLPSPPVTEQKGRSEFPKGKGEFPKGKGESEQPFPKGQPAVPTVPKSKGGPPGGPPRGEPKGKGKGKGKSDQKPRRK